jgi:hypothetical protein
LLRQAEGEPAAFASDSKKERDEFITALSPGTISEIS